jgi:hypothetical protein
MKRPAWWGGCLGFLTAAFWAFPGNVSAKNEAITVPVVVADYYAWAYTEAFLDHAEVYAWSTAGVDALGWTLYLTSQDEAGMKLVNLAGLAKTVYPVVTLLGASNPGIRQRAWIAVGTHATTLLTLEILGRPALTIKTSMGPRQDGTGLELAFRF